MKNTFIMKQYLHFLFGLKNKLVFWAHKELE